MEIWSSICSGNLLLLGWDRVKRNHGRPGVDGISIEEFERCLEQNMTCLAEEIRLEKYEPQPVLIVKIQQGCKERSIGISCVCDRVVQQALYLLLTPLFEPDFLECSYAYRRGKNALLAVDEAQRQLLVGKCWVMETDIANFFDSIKHDLLLDCLCKKIADERVINLIKRCLQISTFDSMNIFDVVLGVSQGSALSPLFGNIYLNQVDLKMSLPDFSYLRYSDDVLVLAETKQMAESALDIFKTEIKKIGLDIKQEKTRILHVRDGFNFLGYHFDLFGKGPSVRALEALSERMKTLGRNTLSLADRIAEVESVLRGWEEYFGAADIFEPEDLYSYYVLLSTSAKRGKLDRLEELAAMRCRIADGDEIIKLHIAEFWLKNNHKVKAVVEAGRLLVENPGSQEAKKFLIKLLGLNEGETGEILRIVQDALRDGREEDYMSLAEVCASKGLYELAMEIQAAALPGQPIESEEERQVFSEEGYDTVLENDNRDSAELIEDQADADSHHLLTPITPVDNIKKNGENYDIQFTSEDIRLFIQLFGGRDGLYATEDFDEAGQRKFIPVHQPFTPNVVKKHLSGETTVGQYMVRSNQTVRYMVIDVDISKRVILAIGDNANEFVKYLDAAQQDAKRILAAASALALPVYLEDSGYRGRHCWLFFERAVRAADARELGQALYRRAGKPSDGISWEIFPNTGKVKSELLGPLIKLPLGRHGKTGRLCLFLDAGGEPVSDQAAFLRNIKPVSQSRIEELRGIVKGILSDGMIHNQNGYDSLVGAAGEKESQSDNTKSLKELGGQLVRNVTAKCSLMAHFLDKVERTGYLTHRERLSMLMVFGHLGDEGIEFIHIAMSRCINYSREVTEKYIRKLLLPKPVSCPRLREFFPELTASLGCDCRFHLTSGTYPSPVLHSLSSKPKDKRVTLPNAGEKKSRAEAATLYNQEADALLKKIAQVRKQIKQLHKVLEKHENDLEIIFKNQNANRLPVEIGTLVKIERGGRVEWIVEMD